MDISGKAISFPPMPTKPTPLKFESAASVDNDLPVEFSPIEELNELSINQQPAQENHAKADSSLRRAASKLDDSTSTLNALENRSTQIRDASMTPVKSALDQYQMNKEGSSVSASLKIDQLV